MGQEFSSFCRFLKCLYRNDYYVCGYFYILAAAFVLLFLGCVFNSGIHPLLQDSLKTLAEAFPKGSNAISFTFWRKSPYKSWQSGCVAFCDFPQCTGDDILTNRATWPGLVI